MYGCTGKILVLDLSAGSIQTIEKDELYYKKYLGGALLCAALYEEFTKDHENLDPFSPDNPIIFATGPMAGEKVCGATRVNVLSLAPESTGIYLSQAGGEFGPCLKRAGFDALVITGKSSKPVMIKVVNDDIQFVDAGDMWGKESVIPNDKMVTDPGKDL